MAKKKSARKRRTVPCPRPWRRPVEFPEGPDQLKEAFRVLNAWACRLRDWETRVRAMCAIMEASYGLNAEQFEAVVRSVNDGYHSKTDTRRTLHKSGSTAGDLRRASDVLGHPPDPPFQEPIT